MRLNEFGNDKGNATIEDVKNNHPEIHAFMEDVVGYMTLEQQTVVEMFNTSSSHHVILTIKPALGLDSTEMLLQRQKVKYERTHMASGDMLSGSLLFASFRMTNNENYGNITEKWDFEIPNN